MQKYIGTKQIEAVASPAPKDMGDHKAGDEGYRVIYPDGYVSWSPKDVFEAAYRPTNGMNYGLAMEAMKQGYKVARTGWNGKGMFCFLVPGSEFKVSRPPLNQHYAEGTDIAYRPHIDMRAPDGTIGVYSPTQVDSLADDWFIVED